jgi:pentatricopeptide repeat protein
MYANCGSIEDARRVFNKMTAHTTISWNAMLAGYAIHGHAKEALGHFEQMCQAGVGLDMVTFVSLLSACSPDCDETLMQLVMRLFLESGEEIFKSGLQWPTVLKHLCISKKKELFTRKFENGRRG